MSRALLVVAALVLPAQSAAQTYLLIVSGLGGEPAYVERFHSWGTNLITAAVRDLGIPEAHVVYLAENPERDPRIQGKSTRDNVNGAFTDLVERIEPSARLAVVLIGHGSATGGEPKLNLPGPDLSVSDVAEQLRRFPSQEIAIVNLTTASGGWLTSLSGERRIVITATRSATERYDTMFGEHFIDALTSDDADTDKNGSVSLLEAFEYARQEVARAYDQENRLLTEHALLDDNGDGKGAYEPELPSGDGARAQTWFLATSANTLPEVEDPVLASLYAERQRIESAVVTLRAQKAATDSLAYEEQLENLLLSLARTNRSIREREGRERS